MTTESTTTTSIAPAAPPATQPPLQPPTDFELHLLQAFGAFASHRVVSSYAYAKQSSRVLGFLAATTEAVVSKTGLVALVGYLFAQYQRLGHPLVQYVDEAMGRRIIAAFVNVLLLAEEKGGKDALPEMENGQHVALKLSYQERLQALLLGEVPRLQAMLKELQQRETEAANAPPVVVMDLEDFVSKEEVARLQEQSREALSGKESKVAALKEQVAAIERARQQLEEKLTDVHNYQESERGQRFQEMEEELARTKLEASQKAHDLRKLELVVEALSRKRKGKGSRSNVSPSVASSEANEDDV